MSSVVTKQRRSLIGAHTKPKRKPATSGAAPQFDRPPPQVAAAVAPGGLDALQGILRAEAEMRAAPSVKALAHLVGNETRRLARARQVFVVRLQNAVRPGERGQGLRSTVVAASSVASVAHDAPLIQTIRQRIAECGRVNDLSKQQGLEALTDRTISAGEGAYPFRELVWIPMLGRTGAVFGGLVCARETVWSEADTLVAARLAETAAHAWSSLDPRMTAPRRLSKRRFVWCAIAVAGLVGLLVPVPLTALAPFEIVPRDPVVVTAPLDGVVATVDVAPNAAVRRGDRLFAFDDTTLRSRNDVAERELRTAEARLKRANQMAFRSSEGRRELAIARAERDVRAAEFDYASLMLSRAVVQAGTSGIAVFNDRKDLIGRPVKTGERLMEIAKSDEVQARLFVPLSDGALLVEGAEVRLFLDTDPLSPVDARIMRADYEAKAHQSDNVSFRAVAAFGPEAQSPPRLGTRGTAQIYGAKVPLALYLFRRPLAALRQWIGL